MTVSAAMTSRQRVEAALNHKEPDRTPIFEYHLYAPSSDTFLGRPYFGDWSRWPEVVQEFGFAESVRRQAVDRVELARMLGHDMLYVRPSNRPVPGQRGPFHVESSCGALDGDPVKRVIERNKRTSEMDFRHSEESMAIYDLLRAEMDKYDMDLPILVPAYAHGCCTDTDLMMTMKLEPEVAHEHFHIATWRSIAAAEQYMAWGHKIIGVGGDFAADNPIISAEMYRTFIVPEVAKVSRRIHELGGWAINASDGNLWYVIEDYFFGCEADGCIEVDYRAGMDLRKLKPLYGDRITFFGNIDCAGILSFGTPEQVHKHTLEVIEAGLGNGGHILCASNAVISSVPYENYIEVVRAYRNYFGLPPVGS